MLRAAQALHRPTLARQSSWSPRQSRAQLYATSNAIRDRLDYSILFCFLDIGRENMVSNRIRTSTTILSGHHCHSGEDIIRIVDADASFNTLFDTSKGNFVASLSSQIAAGVIVKSTWNPEAVHHKGLRVVKKSAVPSPVITLFCIVEINCIAKTIASVSGSNRTGYAMRSSSLATFRLPAHNTRFRSFRTRSMRSHPPKRHQLPSHPPLPAQSSLHHPSISPLQQR